MEGDDFVLFPTLGCFVPGYSLLVPRMHVLSFAESVHRDRAGTVSAFEQAKRLIQDAFGPVIVAEHGAATCSTGASCVDHAHLHLIPFDQPSKVVNRYIAAGGEPDYKGLIEDIDRFNGKPYVLLSIGSEAMVWLRGSFPSQFCRRVLADLHNCGPFYDWRAHPFTHNMLHTVRTLRTRIRNDQSTPRGTTK